jgi:hypothetical protein
MALNADNKAQNGPKHRHRDDRLKFAATKTPLPGLLDYRGLRHNTGAAPMIVSVIP